ncbi:large conductance mechanosensitive channel protein MscL [Tepidamorphus sp. 3E244]|uniref:large conductance mechanosensitive channel protein MscL n=1 Tax=Tepidamorphus sp. 3E244 TaxID=3385498 RepID=UPI0038FBFC05
MIQEFKEFAVKGNMVDLAIGVVIGGAFSKIVNSLVNDIIMPVIGVLTGGVDFSNMFIQLAGAPQTNLEAAREAGATLAYGNFITVVINFLIIAWVLFLVIKAMNSIQREAEQQDSPEAPPPPRDVVLLEEIRDLLKQK